ncbi:MAG TPA: DinB family protein [Chloroflexota bacterium]|nr:DinB family protein [Chloroflexota bacterium]
MNPSLDHIDIMYGRLLDLLRTTDEATLNWTPGVPETNSIAILVAHTVGATTRWLSRAAGDFRRGDRPAEFRTRTTPAQAIAVVEQAKEGAPTWFAALDGLDPSTPRPIEDENEQQTVAWCVEHALTHAHEHWGQIQLTLQLARAALGNKS